MKTVMCCLIIAQAMTGAMVQAKEAKAAGQNLNQEAVLARATGGCKSRQRTFCLRSTK